MTRPRRLLAAALVLVVVGTVVVITRVTDTDATEENALPEPTVVLSATARVLPPEVVILTDAPVVGETSQLLPPEAVDVASASPTGEPTAADVISVAERAVLAWQSPDDQARTEALRTLATSEYQETAATIDATRVPSARPERVLLRSEADGQALVDIQLENGSQLAVILVLEQDRWLLANLQPVLDADPLDVP